MKAKNILCEPLTLPLRTRLPQLYLMLKTKPRQTGIASLTYVVSKTTRWTMRDCLPIGINIILKAPTRDGRHDRQRRK